MDVKQTINLERPNNVNMENMVKEVFSYIVWLLEEAQKPDSPSRSLSNLAENSLCEHSSDAVV
uniref:Uncharacterized protein n=1 Tax=Rhizophagus irregularis (strain DAOM 181602 / DAOM 197198 / MUCL 43194) TaxID=747089 RepID=U9UNQ6_RHIID